MVEVSRRTDEAKKNVLKKPPLSPHMLSKYVCVMPCLGQTVQAYSLLCHNVHSKGMDLRDCCLSEQIYLFFLWTKSCKFIGRHEKVNYAMGFEHIYTFRFSTKVRAWEIGKVNAGALQISFRVQCTLFHLNFSKSD